jgi:hypothetical protein
MKKTLLLAGGAMLLAVAMLNSPAITLAQTSAPGPNPVLPPGVIKKDKQDLRRDHKDIRNDRREIRKDRKERRSEREELRKKRSEEKQ